jgi:hypothetical protein
VNNQPNKEHIMDTLTPAHRLNEGDTVRGSSGTLYTVQRCKRYMRCEVVEVTLVNQENGHQHLDLQYDWEFSVPVVGATPTSTALQVAWRAAEHLELGNDDQARGHIETAANPAEVVLRVQHLLANEYGYTCPQAFRKVADLLI